MTPNIGEIEGSKSVDTLPGRKNKGWQSPTGGNPADGWNDCLDACTPIVERLQTSLLQQREISKAFIASDGAKDLRIIEVERERDSLASEVQRLTEDASLRAIRSLRADCSDLQAELTKAREIETNIRRAIADRGHYLNDPELLQGNRDKYQRELDWLNSFLAPQSAQVAKCKSLSHKFMGGKCSVCGLVMYAPAAKGGE